jgi:hypothetical protein
MATTKNTATTDETTNAAPVSTDVPEQTGELADLGKKWAETGEMKPGYDYRYVTSGGDTKPIVTKRG